MWALIGVTALGILFAIIVKKVVGKIISLVLAAVIVFFVWQQRDMLLERADDLKGGVCPGEEGEAPSFFGIDIALPDGWCAD